MTPKPRYVNDFKVDWSYNDLMVNNSLQEGNLNIIKECDQAFFPTKDNRLIQGFLYLHKGKSLILPELEPSILYFKSAERKLESILTIREELLNSTEFEKIYIAINLFSDFFILSSEFITSLFTAIEAFNNRMIPEDFSIRINKQLMNRAKIQRFAKFEDKCSLVLPQIFEKSFVVSYPEEWSGISSLKVLRDSLIHTKNQSANWAASYREIYRHCLSFDYEKSFRVTFNYMNYYKNNWIDFTENK